MKRLSGLLIVFLLTLPAFGQRAAGGAARAGFGSVVFPGTGRPPAPGAVFRSPFSITDPGFAQRLGNTVSGLPPAGNGGGRFNRQQRGVVVVPYAYPVVSPYPFGYMEPPVQQQPNVTIVNTPPQSPQVIINQNYIPDSSGSTGQYPADAAEQSNVRIYQAPSRAAVEQPAPEENRNYLIAFKDHSIYSALAYWLDGDTLHYVTPLGVHNQASLDLIDRKFTEQLNRERNVQMQLPGK